MKNARRWAASPHSGVCCVVGRREYSPTGGAGASSNVETLEIISVLSLQSYIAKQAQQS